jgi:hypothetical protein
VSFLDDVLSAPAPAAKTNHDPFGVTKIVPAEENLLVEAKNGVQDSRDIRRVAALPRRPRQVTAAADKVSRVVTPELQAKIAALEKRLRRTDDQHCECAKRWPLRVCAKSLLPVQGWALAELEENDGLVGNIGVSEGKSLLDLLAARVVKGCKTAVLLVPANLKHQMVAVNVEYYGQHWVLPNIAGGRKPTGWVDLNLPFLHILSYEEVSNKKSTTLLDDIDPDLYILDESHKLKNSSTSRGRRFWPQVGKPEKPRLTKDGKKKRVAIWTGTLTNNSVLDYVELGGRALGDGAPVPLHHPTGIEWAEALDPSEWAKDMGKLRHIMRPGETLYEGWHNRLAETAGWVSSPDTDTCRASLYFHERAPSVPEKVQQALKGIAVNWERPDGELLNEILEQSRCLRQMAMGFFYRWKWPGVVSEDFKAQWLAARKAWHSEVRLRLKRPRQFMDSPSLLEDAARRFHFPQESDDPNKPRWETDSYEEWVAVRDEFKRLTNSNVPDTVAVWVDDFLVRDAAEWMQKHKGIVWVKHNAFGRALAALTKAPLYLGGEEENKAILQEKGDRAVIASVDAHGTGKDLQFAFSENLFSYSMSNAVEWQQTLGRTHRLGQKADQVDVYVYRHTQAMRGALKKAREKALWHQTTEGGARKLCSATYLFEDDPE